MRDGHAALDIAARSILETHAVVGTVRGVVADRALDHQWEGLFQYAALRVGTERAAELSIELEQQVEAEARLALEADPGPRAFLYARMRALVLASVPRAIDPDMFWPPPEAVRERFVTLRESFTPHERDVVELRYARQLSDEETAFVLDLDLAEVKRVCIVALGLARRAFARSAPSRDRTYEGVLLETFALDPEKARPPRRRARRPVLERGAVIAGRYEIEAQLGAGAFADVYRARDCVVTDHVVALKILRTRAADDRSVQTALRELELIASVFHPSIVQLNDHGWHEGHLWFVMPLYRGETLAHRLSRGPLERAEARAIFEQLAEALAAMHRAGVRHQDIKPDNVFLASLDFEDADQTTPARVLPVLLDLGVAAKDAELVLAGTPAYFAPEVASRFLGIPDPPPVGPKADVFSLALTLRQALEPGTNERIAAGAVEAFVAYRAMHAPLPPESRELRDLTPHFTRWLSKNPDARPTAQELRRELSVLTLPAEQRQRRLSLLRSVLPAALAIIAIFSAVVHVLGREAALQRNEAQHAQRRADKARERVQSMELSLTEQDARRRELERDVARLEEQYQSSRLTRDQLASRLAQIEGEQSMLSERAEKLEARVQKQSEELLERAADREQLLVRLSDTEARAAALRDDLARERTRSADNELVAQRAKQALMAVESELSELRARLAELEMRAATVSESRRLPPAARLERQLHPAAL